MRIDGFLGMGIDGEGLRYWLFVDGLIDEGFEVFF
jgi:hypothetical protein